MDQNHSTPNFEVGEELIAIYDSASAGSLDFRSCTRAAIKKVVKFRLL